MANQTVTLNKALRLKNKMVKHSAELFGRVSKYNSVLMGATRPYDVESAFQDYEHSLVDIVTIKMAIFEANAKVQDRIFRMAELKGEVTRLRSLNTSEGYVQSNRYDDSSVSEYKTVLSQRTVDNLVNKLQKEIDEIQEELNQYNAQTLVEVELYTDFDKEAK